MSLQLLKAGTPDALTLTGISKRAFDSDILVGAESTGGPPGYMSVPFHTKMARQKTESLGFMKSGNGLVVVKGHR